MGSERKPAGGKCPDCEGVGYVEIPYEDGRDEYREAIIDTRNVLCGTCRGTGTLTIAAASVRKARGCPPPVKARRF